MLIRYWLPVLFLYVCTWTHSSCTETNHHLLRCRRSYYRDDKVTAINLGYCWKFMNYNYTYSAAYEQCNRFLARVPAVNTIGKARKLSKFIADSIKLYASGEMGNTYRAVYEKGWPGGNEFWLSDVVDDHWNATSTKVSTSAEEKPAVTQHGRQCVLFNYHKSTWRYTSCASTSGTHPTICEEKEHVYADDVAADGKTTPPVTLAPTPTPLQGATFTCPEGYTVFENHCFFITHGRVTIAEAEKTCESSGGRQAWISEARKDAVVTRYLQANVNKLHALGSVWLSRLEGNGYIFKWRSSGTNARFLLNKNNLYSSRLMEGAEPKLYMFTSGRVSHCKDSCLDYQALCEADGAWKGGKVPEDLGHPAAPVETKMRPVETDHEMYKDEDEHDEGEHDDEYYEEDYYDYDYDLDPPTEETKFDPNSILTKGP